MKSDIEVHRPCGAQDIATRIAEGVWGIRSEGRSVEPLESRMSVLLCDGICRCFEISHYIWPVVVPVQASLAGIGWISVHGQVERQASAEGHDRVDTPSSKCGVLVAIPVASESPSASKGKIVYRGPGEVMPY